MNQPNATPVKQINSGSSTATVSEPRFSLEINTTPRGDLLLWLSCLVLLLGFALQSKCGTGKNCLNLKR
jgi:hypothetical protein